MSPTLTRYSRHPQPSTGRYVLATVIIAGVASVWREPGIWPGVMATPFALAACGLFIQQHTRVDTDARTVVREGWLFGRFRVWQRRHSLSDFTAVVMGPHPQAEGDGAMSAGLLRRRGRPLEVSYFHVDSGEVERMAQSLADLTGLPLRDEMR